MANQIITDVVSGTLTYTGEAIPWTPTSQKSWTIKKTAVSGGVTTISYPQGYNGFPTSNPQFAWDDRASLDFSLTPDENPAILTTVTIESDNIDTTVAVVWDTITLTFVSDEYLPIDPVVEIAGHTATVVGSTRKSFTATYDMVEWDTPWVVPFSIDIIDNTGLTTTTTTTTDDSEVTFNIPPEMISAERMSNTVIKVTLSEDADDTTITKANAGWFVVKDTVTPATTYAVSAIAKSGSNSNQIELTVATILASAATGVTVTYVAWWNGTVADPEGNLMATDATGVLVAAWA